MKTLNLFVLFVLVSFGVADAQTRAPRVILGVMSMALGGYALAYDPPDVTETVHGSGGWQTTHEDFRCALRNSVPYPLSPVRVGDWCKLGAILTVPGQGSVIVAGPSSLDDNANTRRVPHNTTYRGTVRTATQHTTEVPRSTAQVVAGAGAIVSGALLAFWPDAPVDVDPGPGRIRLSRTFGF